jgi:tRNA pseudouridine13 synthase
MLLKLLPEDFVVDELIEFEPSEKGTVAVYELRKKKVDTFEAIRRLAAAARLPLGAISYVGLKDRQAVTTQLISVTGGRLDPKKRISGVKVRYLGRAPEPIAQANLRGNAFTIVVRDLGRRDIKHFEKRLERVAAHGLINYFDDQRFGTIAMGQGMPGRFLALGEYEAAVRAMVATPGLRDPIGEKKFKHLISKQWGQWDSIARKWGTRRGAGLIRHLRRKPTDFRGALRNYPGNERAIHVFAYQSLIWNRAVARYLAAKTPESWRSTTPYVAGEHSWLEYPPDVTLPDLVESFPLIDHTSKLEDPAVAAAVAATLAEEGLTLEGFRIRGIRGCFFRHYERPLRVRPTGLQVVSPPTEDDRRPGRLKLTVRFELPPGSYATLTIKRLFGKAPEVADGRPPKRKGKDKKLKDKKHKDKQGKGKQGKGKQHKGKQHKGKKHKGKQGKGTGDK